MSQKSEVSLRKAIELRPNCQRGAPTGSWETEAPHSLGSKTAGAKENVGVRGQRLVWLECSGEQGGGILRR